MPKTQQKDFTIKKKELFLIIKSYFKKWILFSKYVKYFFLYNQFKHLKKLEKNFNR
jgi:hypothetical protein